MVWFYFQVLADRNINFLLLCSTRKCPLRGYIQADSLGSLMNEASEFVYIMKRCSVAGKGWNTQKDQWMDIYGQTDSSWEILF